MKPKIAPTSPKTKHEQQAFEQLYAAGLQTIEKPRRVPVGLTLALAFVVGVVGVVGGLAGVTALSDRVPADSWIRFFVPSATERVVVERNASPSASPEQVAVDRNDAIRPVLVGVYAGVPTTLETVADLPSPASFRGTGVIVANNGLIVTTRDVVPEPSTHLAILLSDQRLFPVTAVTLDPVSPYVFLTVEGSDFRSAKFAGRTTVVPGLDAFAYSVSGIPDTIAVNATVVSAVDVRRGDGSNALVESSDELDRLLLVSGAPLAPGTAVFNGSGEVLGVAVAEPVTGQQAIAPIWHMRAALRQLLRGTDLIRPSLGVTTVDVSRLPADTALTDRTVGALVASANATEQPAVAPRGAAASAGVKANDVVLQVNGLTIDRQNPLSEVVQDLTPGERATLTLARGAEELDVEVTLGILRP